jgi:hypothetical protein
MPVKRIYLPHLGRTVKLGRRHPVARGLQLSFKRYLVRRALPTPPTTVDYSRPALSELNKVYLNDKLGDCVIAAGYHMVAVETGNGAGAPFAVSDAQLIADYSAIGGYDPNAPLVPDPKHPGEKINPTDQGCDEVTALNFWCEKGFANGTNAVAWIAVDASNKVELSLALYLFENLFFGLDLPDAWLNPSPSSPGFTWDVAGPPVPENGHAVVGVGYASAGVQFDTWGMLGTMTWAAIAKYCSPSNDGGVYAMLTPDQLLTAQTKAPNGVDWSALIDDLDALGVGIPKITSPQTLTGKVGVNLTYQITATNSPKSFSATKLPAGLAVNKTTGLITGKPTSAGESTFTVAATNGNGSGAQLVGSTIQPGSPTVLPPVITSAPTFIGTVGVALKYQIRATNHPTSFAATGLPGGLNVDPTTGVISGTPTTAGSASVQLSARNSAGTGTKTLALTVRPRPTPHPTTPHPTHTGTSGTPPTSGMAPLGVSGVWVPPPLYPVPPVPPIPPAPQAPATPALAELGRQLPELGRQVLGGVQGSRKAAIVAASGIVVQGLLTILAIAEDGGNSNGGR